MRKKLYINGEWLESNQVVDLISPYNGAKIAEIPSATEDEIERAIQAAMQARDGMAAMPAHKRASILEKVAALLAERIDEATAILVQEAAKPIRTARAEIERTVQTYKFAAEEAKRIHGETIPLDAAPGGENRIAYTIREPLGVVAAITPFNFPFNLVAHKVGPAIAAGNTVVLKPASQTPLSALFMAELFHEAGLLAGAFNVVTGSGRLIGDALVKDDRVNKITFTGSPAVGIAIRNKAGLKRVTLELGSNSGLIVDEGVDLNRIIPRCVSGAFAYQGQVCISLQRIYVHDSLYEAFVAKLVSATNKLVLGDPQDPRTDVSAMISPNDTQRSLEWIEEARQNGAVIAAGGTLEGNILRPTVIVGADPQSKVSCQEVFAPIVIVDKISSVEEGIERINNSRFGLQAGIYTNNINTAFNAAKRLHVGGVMINDIPTFRVDHMPYGGVKDSGIGREGVKYAVEEMTEMKLIVINQE
jgi:acyl-CoA reductase-like NAD-dependent aldehyde dehydrogenase